MKRRRQSRPANAARVPIAPLHGPAMEAGYALVRELFDSDFSLVFQCEPSTAIEDQKDGIKVIAEFHFRPAAATASRHLSPIIKWGKGEQSHSERLEPAPSQDPNVLSFQKISSTETFGKGRTRIELFPNPKARTAIAACQLTIVSRAMVEEGGLRLSNSTRGRND